MAAHSGCVQHSLMLPWEHSISHLHRTFNFIDPVTSLLCHCVPDWGSFLCHNYFHAFFSLLYFPICLSFRGGTPKHHRESSTRTQHSFDMDILCFLNLLLIILIIALLLSLMLLITEMVGISGPGCCTNRFFPDWEYPVDSQSLYLNN